MKSFGRVEILEENARWYELGTEVEQVLHLENDSVLHGVAIFFTGDGQANPIGPLHSKMTVVLSPFPIASWKRLIRTSVTLSPEAGTLHALVGALNKAGIFCRHIEHSNDLDLRDLRIFRGADSGIPAKPRGTSNYIVPTALLTLELPVKDLRRKFQTKEMKYLHENLNMVVECEESRNESRNSDARASLEKYLNSQISKFKPGIELGVDWVSPLVTLNRLGEAGFIDSSPLARNFASMELIVKKDDTGKSVIDLGYILRQLSRAKSRPSDVLRQLEKRWLACVSHVDSDEKILCIDIFTQPDVNDLGVIIVEMDLVLPASAFENLWIEWVLERVKEGGGTILNAKTGSRTRDRFLGLKMVVIFKLNPDREDGGPGDIARIIRSFRELSGDTYSMPSFVEFMADLRGKRKNLKIMLNDYDFMERAEAASGRKPRSQSLLLIRRIWEPFGHGSLRKYHLRFRPNPFDFTKPLNESKFSDLYDLPFDGSSKDVGDEPLDSDFAPNLSGREIGRRSLVSRIAERISMGENISVVGAPRSGKTSILWSVRNKLRIQAQIALGLNEKDFESMRGDDAEKAPANVVIPVVINAAIVPPHEIGVAILAELGRWVDDLVSKSGSVVEAGKRRAGKTLSSLLEFVKNTKVSPASLAIQAGFASVEVEEKLGPQLIFDGSVVERLLERSEAKKLHETLLAFAKAIGEVEKKSGGSLKLKAVIIIDEVGNLSGWGKLEFLHSLRQAIEDDAIAARVRWLISTSRPISESPTLSPLTNVFKDYNIGSLGSEECRRLFANFCFMSNPNFDTLPKIDSYYDNTSQKRRPNVASVFVEKMAPILTFRARAFVHALTCGLPYLMQVFLYHLYERSTRFAVPVINRRTCVLVLNQFVIPEISDYLEGQWRQVPVETRRQVLKILEGFSSTWEFIRPFSFSLLEPGEFSPSALKILSRAGLRGTEGPIVAPLVAVWIISVEANLGEIS